MAQNVVESIFNSKNNLNDFWPQFSGVKTFDLQKKHLFYGRIDLDGDAVYLDSSNIKQIQGGRTGTHLAVDFVCAAFADLRKNIKSAANKNYVSKDSLFPTNLKVTKSWTTGDLEYSYNKYLNKLYTTFVDSYLTIDRRAAKIKNYRDFVKEFLRFILRTAEYFPLTRTGYLTSIHSSPFVSGLMIEIAREKHGLHNNMSVMRYVQDVNFTFFVNEVKKYGFMMDKNAPWRLVFNLASGQKQKRESGGKSIAGGQLYMGKSAVDFNTVFPIYYRKAYLDELINLKRKFFSLYESFYLQFSTYEEVKYITTEAAPWSIGNCQKVVTKRKDREPPGSRESLGANVIFPGYAHQQQAKETDEYWLKILLKLRLAETRTAHSDKGFDFLSNEIIQHYRTFGLPTALDEINDLTKGFEVTNFLSKGRYWYGVSEREYQKRKMEIAKKAHEPSLVDYSLTGCKNRK